MERSCCNPVVDRVSDPERFAAWHERTNPFSTRWTRPGAIPFDFGVGTTIEELLQRFWCSDCQGAIVGAHGSGKSTLLATILPALEAAGRVVVVAQLHDGQRRLPLSRRWLAGLGRDTILVIDGYEQLGRLRRWRLLNRARRQGFGLLITSHKPAGVPLLCQMSPDIELVKRLVQRHLPPHAGRITPQDIERAWLHTPGDVREVFFELYDVFEARRAVGEL